VIRVPPRLTTTSPLTARGMEVRMMPAKAKIIDDKRILEVIDLKTSFEIEFLLRGRIDSEFVV
jgi:hypothetical protein